MDNENNEYDRLLDDENQSIQQDQRMETKQKVYFGLGHVFNDIAATIWFSYTLVFLQNVVGLPSTMAGFLLFFGQIMDAVSTPIVGLLVDKFSEKKKWMFLGSIMEVLSFPLIYYNWNLPMVTTTLLYIFTILIFQISWALVQISHLSLIPELTLWSEERGKLTSIRYVFTVSTNIVMFIIAWFVFRGVRNPNDLGNLIGPKDSPKFQILALIATTVGVISSLLFQMLLKNTNTAKFNKIILYKNRSKIKFDKVLKFCKSVQLYQVAIVFTSCKLLINMALIYLPLFINESVVNDSSTIASIPLVAFVSSLVASMSIEHIKIFFKTDRIVFTLGSIISICGSLLVFFNPNNELTYHYLCLAAICFGSGNAITSVVSLCITANLVGKDTDCGAFIYSSVTFSDKLINGIAIIGIEFMKCPDFAQCTHYYRDVLAFSSGSLAFIGLIVFWTMPNKLVKTPKRSLSHI